MAKTVKQLKSEKIGKVMTEYKDKSLHSGKVVKDRKTAIAIALSESSKVKLPKKKK